MDCITEWILTRSNDDVSIPGYYKVCKRLRAHDPQQFTRFAARSVGMDDADRHGLCCTAKSGISADIC